LWTGNGIEYLQYGQVAWALTNDSFSDEEWALNSPGSKFTTTWANYFSGPSGEDSYLIGFGANKETWDQFGNAITISYGSPTEGDYSQPNETNFSIVDVSDNGPAEESSYHISTGGWLSTDFVWWIWPVPAVYTVSRNVATSYSLRTGGKAASQRQAVFKLAVTATNMIHLGTPSPTGVPVPYSQIKVMGQPLGNDNNLFVGEPDGISVPVSVDVPGSPSFTYNITPYKYPVNIQATAVGTTYQLDVVPQQVPQGFYIGQFVYFSLHCEVPELWIPTWPFGQAQWTSTGNFYNAWQPTEGANPRYHYPVNSYHFYENTNLLNLPVTAAWWVTGGDGQHANVPAQYRATTTQTMLFLNGQTVKVNPFGLFNMYAPTTSCDPYTTDPWIAGGELQAYIWFPHTVSLPFGQGDIVWIQVLTSPGTERSVGWGVGHGDFYYQDTPGPNFLDIEDGESSIPYDDRANCSDFDTDNSGSPFDQPALPVGGQDTWAKVLNESFLMTTFYTPPGVNPPSPTHFWSAGGIPVPVRAIAWHWTADFVHYLNNGGGYWSPLSAAYDKTIVDSNQKTSNYPEWKSESNCNLFRTQ